MKQKIILSLISFLYTPLFLLAMEEDLLIFNVLTVFSADGIVNYKYMRLMSLVLFAILYIGILLLVAVQFKRIRGAVIHIYLSSLASSFLMPLFFDSLNSASFLRFEWYFTGAIYSLLNLLFGPAMAFLLSYFVVGAVKMKK